MGRKSSGQNKGEGALDKAKGKAKEAVGSVTGDEAKNLKDALTKRRAAPRTSWARQRTCSSSPNKPGERRAGTKSLGPLLLRC